MSKQAEQYFADHASSETEVERLGRICKVYDDWTKERLTGAGISKGFQCAEIGYGTGSMLAWISDQVGDTGSAHGYDLTPRFTKAGILTGKANVELFQHNIQSKELPSKQYDLIYTRLLLAHLFEPIEAIKHIKNGLKANGKLVALDYDSTVVRAECDHPLASGFDAAVDLMNETINADGLISACYGAEMGEQFAGAGFTNVEINVMPRYHIGGDFGACLSADGINLLGQARPELQECAQTISAAMRTPGFQFRDTDMYCCIGENEA